MFSTKRLFFGFYGAYNRVAAKQSSLDKQNKDKTKKLVRPAYNLSFIVTPSPPHALHIRANI